MSEFTEAAGAARLGMAAHLRAVTAARRPETDVAVLEANRLDAAARDLAGSVPAFAPALGAFNAGLHVVPLTEGGSAMLLGCEPTRDLSRLLSYWTEHPSAPAGLPTGIDYDLIAAAVDSSGWEWLRTSSVDGEAEGDRQQRLDPVFGLVRLIEQRPAVGPWRSMTFFGDDEMAEAGNKLRSRTTPAVRDILVWRWPSGWSLRPGRRARGVHLLSVVPADGSEVRDGKTWRCQWTGGIGRLQPMPAWMAEALSGRRTAAP